MCISSEEGGHHQNNIATRSVIRVHTNTVPVQIFRALLP